MDWVRKILEYVRGKLECVREKNGICQGKMEYVRKKLECAMKKWNKSPKNFKPPTKSNRA